MIKDITGKKFNHLTALELDHIEKKPDGTKHYWLFRCDCGNTKVIEKFSVTSGHTKTCGCNMIPLFLKEIKKTKLYSTWRGMINRCYLKTKSNYRWYGAKGIEVCSDWNCPARNGFINFYSWSINNGYKDGLELDRINSDGNYCPENCRWISHKENTRNMSSNKIITIFGEKNCLSYFLEKYKTSRATYYRRIYSGWKTEKAITTETRRRNG